jgi:hypothetical protein
MEVTRPMIYPVVPADKRAVIRVSGLRARVSRYVQTSPRGTFDVEEAVNWEVLEEAAIEAVEAVGGAIWHDDDYPCPEVLAEQAEWPD